MSIFHSDYLTQYSMRVQDIKIFVQLLFLYYPSRQLVDLLLSTVFVCSEIVQKLFFLPVLIDYVDQFVFQIGFLVSYELSLRHCALQLLLLFFNIIGLLLQKLGPQPFRLINFLFGLILHLMKILILHQPFLNMYITLLNPLCIFLRLFLRIQRRYSIIIQLKFTKTILSK